MSPVFKTLFDSKFVESETLRSEIAKFSPRTLSQFIAYVYGYNVDLTWLDFLAMVHFSAYYDCDEYFLQERLNRQSYNYREILRYNQLKDLYTTYTKFIQDDITRSIEFIIVCRIHLDNVLQDFMVRIITLLLTHFSDFY